MVLKRKTVSVFVTKRCNMSPRCYYCIAGCGKAGEDTETEPDIDACFKWLKAFVPGCNVHVTGGEPLLRDLRSFLTRLVECGFRVTLFTNGMLLQNNRWLFDLPVVFHVTHHYESGVGYAEFFDSVSGIPADRLQIARLFTGEAVKHKADCEAHYEGYNFKWISPFGTYHDYDGNSSESPVSNIALIGQCGNVFKCSSPDRGVLGNIYRMEFAGWPIEPCGCGLPSKKCNAFLSAQLMEERYDDVYKL